MLLSIEIDTILSEMSEDRCIADINRDWDNEIVKDIKPKSKTRVRFGENRIYPMISWKWAYHYARKGPWEIVALDRMRFHQRIKMVSPILSRILESSHRKQMIEIMQHLYKKKNARQLRVEE